MNDRGLPETIPDRPVRILLVDDHRMFREGLAEVLGREGDFLVCGEAANRREALAIIDSATPDLALVDLTLPDGNGIELVKDLRALHSKLAVLVVSMHAELMFAERAIAAGARGYITKLQASSQLVLAIREVLSGKIVVSDELTQIALKRLNGRSTPDNRIRELSDRETQVLELIGNGYSSREIAAQLHLDLSTVESYRARIKEKLHLKDASELLRYAIQWAHGKFS